jgi:hypothetical protein
MAKKHDPFFVHLWDELTSANILQHPEARRWLDVPGQIQGQFVEAAKRAMNAALGVKQPRRKAAKKASPKAKAKAKPKAKAKAKPKTKAKAKKKTGRK